MGRSDLKLFLLLTSITAITVVALTWPKHRPQQGLPARLSYISYASLLLPSQVEFRLDHMDASINNNDLEMWLGSEILFRRFLDDHHIQDKIEESVRKKDPRWVEAAQSIDILPMFFRSGQAAAEMQEERLAKKQGNFIERRAGFATSGKEKKERVKFQRVNRIVLQGTGPTPEASQVILTCAMGVIQQELIAESTRRPRQRRKQVESYISLSQQRINKLTRILKLLGNAEPETLALRERTAASLRARCQQMERETQELAVEIQQASGNAGVQALMRRSGALEALEEVQQEIKKSEKIYQTGAPALLRLEERLKALTGLTQTLGQAEAARNISALSVRLAARRAVLAECRSQLAALRSDQPSNQKRRRYLELLHQLDQWDKELLSWEQELVNLKIEERLCQSKGTAIPLREPMPGTVTLSTAPHWSLTYQRTLELLPICPLIGIIGLFLARMLRGSGKIGTRAEFYLDAPILVELPKLSKDYERNWLALKYRTKAQGETKSP